MGTQYAKRFRSFVAKDHLNQIGSQTKISRTARDCTSDVYRKVGAATGLVVNVKITVPDGTTFGRLNIVLQTDGKEIHAK